MTIHIAQFPRPGNIEHAVWNSRDLLQKILGDELKRFEKVKTYTKRTLNDEITSIIEEEGNWGNFEFWAGYENEEKNILNSPLVKLNFIYEFYKIGGGKIPEFAYLRNLKEKSRIFPNKSIIVIEGAVVYSHR